MNLIKYLKMLFTNPNSIKGYEYRIENIRDEVKKGKISKAGAEKYIEDYLKPQIRRLKEKDNLS